MLMKGLIQRVSSASVSVDHVRISHIGQGLLVFLGVEKNDDAESARRLCQRVARYRVFPDAAGRMNLSLADAGGSLLVVPQFTLAADTRSGNRPGFSTAAAPSEARFLYLQFIGQAQDFLGETRVAAGQFGAEMQVSLINDGPVTFLLETAE
jgi:D-tyrosyl-tRNA(Tyr) deacylase